MKKIFWGMGIFPGIGMLFALAMNLEEAYTLEIDFTGQLSGWASEMNLQDGWQNQVGMRYLPQLIISQILTDDMFIDLDVALNGFVVYADDMDDVDSDLDLYRLTLRFATAQTETRVGLQKMNFGPAQLLRALRWFDQLDQRDPLQMTEGVYALLFRYTALNNANVWLWGLYGNDEVKGFEHFPSVEDKGEFGGRVQHPVWNGELAATLHTRIVEGIRLKVDDFPETRIALDGRWEKGIGLWFESVLQHQHSEQILYKWSTITTMGIDYTFGIGNGLYLVLEHMLAEASDNPFGWSENAQMSAYLLSYPIGLFDVLSTIGYYHWEMGEYSQHLSWQRTYDNLLIHASLFRHPDQEMADSQAQQQTGYGGQLMLIYYH